MQKMNIYRIAGLLLIAGLSSAAQAAVITWDGGGVGSNWYSGDNWSGTPDNTVPNINGTDNVLIGSASAVTYNPGVDFDPVTGTTVTVSGGSSVTQTSGQLAADEWRHAYT